MEFKGPAEELDFVNDLTAELGTDTISTSAWVLDTGITLGVNTNTTTASLAWISSGVLGMTYKIVNTIVTSAGRTHVREWYLRIQDQRAG